MATAKKAAPKAATTLSKSAPAKALKPSAKKVAPKAPAAPVKKVSAKTVSPAAKPSAAKKAPASKAAKAVAKINASLVKLNERKAKITLEINALKDQRTQLKATPAPAAVPSKAVKAAPRKLAKAK